MWKKKGEAEGSWIGPLQVIIKKVRMLFGWPDITNFIELHQNTWEVWRLWKNIDTTQVPQQLNPEINHQSDLHMVEFNFMTWCLINLQVTQGTKTMPFQVWQCREWIKTWTCKLRCQMGLQDEVFLSPPMTAWHRTWNCLSALRTIEWQSQQYTYRKSTSLWNPSAWNIRWGRLFICTRISNLHSPWWSSFSFWSWHQPKGYQSLEGRSTSIEMAFLVSAAKRQRSEVRISNLSPAERQMFCRKAKTKEVESWLSPRQSQRCCVTRSQRKHTSMQMDTHVKEADETNAASKFIVSAPKP